MDNVTADTTYTVGSDKKPVTTKYQVKVDPSKCIGAASCVAVAVKTFKLNQEDKAEIMDQDGNSDEEKMLAAQSCPTGAIEVYDIATGEKVWPK
jgi:ferredoxin